MASKKAEEKKLKQVLAAFMKVKPRPKQEAKSGKRMGHKTKAS